MKKESKNEKKRGAKEMFKKEEKGPDKYPSFLEEINIKMLYL
jgi:hypothetical protein